MSGCEQISGTEYARMNINEFAKVVNACESVVRLIVIKREIDGMIYLSRICPRYVRLYPDLNERREMLVAQWDVLNTFKHQATNLAPEPVTL